MRTKSPCKELYNMEELEREAEEVKKKQRAEWECAHREERNASSRKKYQETSWATPRKRASNIPFTCSICDKEFTTKQVMERHIDEQHRGKERAKCPECPKTFTREEYMMFHLATYHGGKKFKYQCSACEKTFEQECHLTRHHFDVHKEKLRFPCPVCPQLFSRQENLDYHVEKGRHTVYITCEYCGKDIEFKSDAEIWRHYIKDPDSRTRSKNTCVNVLKDRGLKPPYKKKEHDPSVPSTCSYCQEIVPNDVEHVIIDPSHQRHDMTCINELKKRKLILCWDCNEKFKFEDLRKHWPEGTNFSLFSDHPARIGIAPCKNRLKKREEWDKISKAARRLGTL